MKKLKNKIILLENADPGFDFIFAHEIKGLITKYGGSNSHMAIRCLELSVPAIIGKGGIEKVVEIQLNQEEKLILINLVIVFPIFMILIYSNQR